jgi:hypothetical protein
MADTNSSFETEAQNEPKHTKSEEKYTEKFKVEGKNLVSFIKKVIQDGNAHRIIILDKKDKPLAEIPLTFGIIGMALAPVLVTIAAIAALATECTVLVERKN